MTPLEFRRKNIKKYQIEKSDIFLRKLLIVTVFAKGYHKRKKISTMWMMKIIRKLYNMHIVAVRYKMGKERMKRNGRKRNLKGGRLRMFQIAVLSLSLLLASVSVGGCLLGDLAQEFPYAPTWYLQMFVTFPVIGGVVANIIGGAMASRIGKKNLCLIGIAMCFLGGFLPMFAPTLGLKIAIRVVASLGVGLIQPLSASLIIDYFEGKVANAMMGLQSSCVGLGASVFLIRWLQLWFITGILHTVHICMQLQSF